MFAIVGGCEKGTSTVAGTARRVRRESSRLMFAIVDDPRQLGAQVLPRYDPIHEAVLEQELAGLETVGPAADKPLAAHGRVGHPRLGLLGFQPFSVQDAVHELQGILRPKIGEPLFEAFLIEQLPDAFAGSNVEMMIAFRADVGSALG